MTDDVDRLLMPVLAGRRLIVAAGAEEGERTALLDRLGRAVEGNGGLGLRARPAPDADIEAVIREAARSVLPGEAGEADLGELVERLERYLDDSGFGLLMVEDAQGLSAGTIADLAELSASTTTAGNYLQVLLAGPAGLAEALEGLATEIGLRPGAVILIGAPALDAGEPGNPAEPGPPVAAVAALPTGSSPAPPADSDAVVAEGDEDWNDDLPADPPPPPREERSRGRVLGLSALALVCVCAFAVGFGAHAVFFAKGDPLKNVPDELRAIPGATAAEAHAPAGLEPALPPLQEASLPPAFPDGEAGVPAGGMMADGIEDMGGTPTATDAVLFPPASPGTEGGERELFEWGDGTVVAAAPIPRPPPPRAAASVSASAASQQPAPARQRAAARKQVVEEDACRRGVGGQTAREASLAGFAQGFISDLRSLGSCIRDGLGGE